MGKYSAGHPKPCFDSFATKLQKKTGVKHSTEKRTLHYFVDLSAIFCPRLQYNECAIQVVSRVAE